MHIKHTNDPFFCDIVTVIIVGANEVYSDVLSIFCEK